MKTMLALLGAIVIVQLGGGAAGDATKKEQDKLQGTWVVVEAEQNGQPLDRIKGGKLIVRENNFPIETASGSTLKGDLMLDGSKSPKRIAFAHQEGLLRDKHWQGIYKLEGDK